MYLLSFLVAPKCKFNKTKINILSGALDSPARCQTNTTVTTRTKPSFYHILGSLENSPNMFLTHFYLVYLLGLVSKRQSISYVSRSSLSCHPNEKLFYLLPCAHVRVSRFCLFTSFLMEGPICLDDKTIGWFLYYKVMKLILRLELIKRSKSMP